MQTKYFPALTEDKSKCRRNCRPSRLIISTDCKGVPKGSAKLTRYLPAGLLSGIFIVRSFFVVFNKTGRSSDLPAPRKALYLSMSIVSLFSATKDRELFRRFGDDGRGGVEAGGSVGAGDIDLRSGGWSSRAGYFSSSKFELTFAKSPAGSCLRLTSKTAEMVTIPTSAAARTGTKRGVRVLWIYLRSRQGNILFA